MKRNWKFCEGKDTNNEIEASKKLYSRHPEKFLTRFSRVWNIVEKY